MKALNKMWISALMPGADAIRLKSAFMFNSKTSRIAVAAVGLVLLGCGSDGQPAADGADSGESPGNEADGAPDAFGGPFGVHPTCTGPSLFPGLASDPGRLGSSYDLQPLALDEKCAAADPSTPYFVRELDAATASCAGDRCTVGECCTANVPEEVATVAELPTVEGTQTCGSSVFVNEDKQQAQSPDTLCRDADPERPFFDPAKFDAVCPGLTCLPRDCCRANQGAEAPAGTFAAAMTISEVSLSKELDGKRIYLGVKRDSSVDLLWADEPDGKAIWTRLALESGGDERREVDVVLDPDSDRTGAQGLVSLPDGGIAAVRMGATGGHGGPHHDKFLAEFDPQGNLLREQQLRGHQAYPDTSTWGYTSRPGQLALGYYNENKGMAYTYFAEANGGGHYWGTTGYVDTRTFEPWRGTGRSNGCSHFMEEELVHNHEAQMRGAFCVQDGVGGLYQFTYSLNNMYKFGNAYGDVMQQRYLGDAVAWDEGFVVTMAVPPHGPGDGVSTAMFSRYTNEATSVAILYTGTHSKSGPAAARTIMNDPRKYAADVKAAFWGDKRDGKLAVFWQEYDVPDDLMFPYAWNDGGTIRERVFSQSPRYMVAIVDLTGVESSHTTPRARVVYGPEDLTASGIRWRHQERFVNTPNGDIVWPMYSADSPAVVEIARIHSPAVVDGGWSHWSPCDCTASKQARSCTSPVPASGGAPCDGEASRDCSCDDQAAQFDTYPKGLDPLLQDADFTWLAAPSMRLGVATSP